MYLVELMISLSIFGFLEFLLYMSLRYKLRHRYRACFGLLLCILAIRVPWYFLLSPYEIDAAIAMPTLMLGGIWFIITMD
ncbi:hypothetical protein SAMN05216604_10128 [Pseudomonas agarici]|nr:hypothetical protein SAMN05216604_10128 [Pseudomonas agarici]